MAEDLTVQIFYDQSHAALTTGTSPFDSLTTADTNDSPVLYRVTRSANDWPTEVKPWHDYVETRLSEIEDTSTWAERAAVPVAAARQFVRTVLGKIDPPAPSVTAVDDEECIEFSWQKNGMHLIAAFSDQGTEIAWMSNSSTGAAEWLSPGAFEGFFNGLTRVSSDALGASLAAQ